MAANAEGNPEYDAAWWVTMTLLLPAGTKPQQYDVLVGGTNPSATDTSKYDD